MFEFIERRLVIIYHDYLYILIHIWFVIWPPRLCHIFTYSIFAVLVCSSKKYRVSKCFNRHSKLCLLFMVDWRFLSLIIFSTLIDYSIGQMLRVEQARFKRKILLGFSILINIGFLGSIITFF